MFRDQYVTTDELCNYLQAADVFVSPYLNEAQVTSGALSYAMGAGAAVVSTPYWHAKELLADGRGRLFPFGDSAALATDDHRAPARRRRSWRGSGASGYEYTRAFTWPRVGAQYLSLGATLPGPTARGPAAPEPPRASSLPELRLDHLVRMTDDTGIIQHATFSVPARETGYCVDDNARALIVALHADRLSGSRETRRLVSTYLGFLHVAQTADGRFRNFMSYDRAFAAGTASEDCTGRALWALGTAVQLASDEGQRMLARQMFERGLRLRDRARPTRHRADHAGAHELPDRAPGGRRPPRRCCARLSQRLCRQYRERATPDWRWFEPTLTYDNALLPLALWRAHADHAAMPASRDVARESLEFLEADLLPGRSPGAGRQRRLASRGGTRRPTPTSSRSTPRRSCSRSGARTW